MKAVILVGGMGTRLRPITFEIPKPLVPVKKKPLVNHRIEFLAGHGVTEVALLASRSHFDDFRRWKKAWGDELPQGVAVHLFYEEKPRGTFGGFEMLRQWIGKEPFLMMNGDDLCEMDIRAMVAFHAKGDALGTLALTELDDVREKGVPVMEGDRIVQFLEKPQHMRAGLISAGIYVLDPKVFEYADFNKENLMIEKDIFPQLASAGKLRGYKANNMRWYDCGTMAGWEKAIREW
ncbi:MAG: nucleotidyltransferase family protein [bacterium]|nr:nucleotidyltransferase family protein [bacterium]